MKIGIIVEYNPFHNGHKYHLAKIKEMFPNCQIIAAMSGTFVQRGEKAILSFVDRKKIALEQGVNQIVEIPITAVLQAAKYFAQEAIKVLAEQGVEKIVFGSESNDIKTLYELIYIEKKPNFRKILKKYLKCGNSYKVAYNKTTQELSGKTINMPNDILAFEYIKAIIAGKYQIEPISIERKNSYYSEHLIKEDIISATSIRNILRKNGNVNSYLPYSITNYKIVTSDHLFIQFKKIINVLNIKEINQFKLVDEGIENRFKKLINKANSYNEFVNMANSKRYSSARIKRTIANIILGFKK